MLFLLKQSIVRSMRGGKEGKGHEHSRSCRVTERKRGHHTLINQRSFTWFLNSITFSLSRPKEERGRGEGTPTQQIAVLSALTVLYHDMYIHEHDILV